MALRTLLGGIYPSATPHPTCDWTQSGGSTPPMIPIVPSRIASAISTTALQTAKSARDFHSRLTSVAS
eukprot:1153913-Rhodomonas_salina.1